MAQDELTHSMANAALYLEDFAAWCQQTAAALRSGRWDTIDLEAVAEEVESLGKRESRELASRLTVLVMHLLKWEYQPERRQVGQSWANTIMTQRSELGLLLRDNPSFRPRLAAVLTDVYPTARRQARVEMAPGMPIIDVPGAGRGLDLGLEPIRLSPPALPDACPWSVEQVLRDDFWPGQVPPGLG